MKSLETYLYIKKSDIVIEIFSTLHKLRGLEKKQGRLAYLVIIVLTYVIYIFCDIHQLILLL